MNLLKKATRHILQLIPMLSVPKERVEISKEDCLATNLIQFKKKKRYLIVENDRHIEKMMKDTSITKEYLSTEIAKEYEYLPFIQLGIEYLKQHAEHEDAQKGYVILTFKIREIANKIEEERQFVASLQGVNYGKHKRN